MRAITFFLFLNFAFYSMNKNSGVEHFSIEPGLSQSQVNSLEELWNPYSKVIISNDDLNFEFAALDFTNPSTNEYKYMLKGLDTIWIEAGKNRFASYTDLDPGEYEFCVISSNNHSRWNQTGASIKFVVLSPYWKTWWFYTGSFCILIFLVWIIHHWRVKRFHEIERLRVNIASDLHDDIGSTLTKISMNAEMIEYEDNLAKIKPKLKKIQESSREAITAMSDVVWSIDSRNDTLGDLIERMKSFSFSLFSDTETEVKYEIINLNAEKKISINQRQNIYMIFKEAINNAAKYSRSGSVDIELKNYNGSFTMKISDNGVGLHEKLNGNGNGFRNMKMRAKLLNGELKILNHNGVTVLLNCKVI